LGQEAAGTEMDYSELEEIIKREYGQELEVAIDLEAANDTAHSFHFEVHPWDAGSILDKHAMDCLAKFKAHGTGSYLTRVLMQDMVNNGVLQPGYYLIQVSW
jgi:hypothetical protein